MKVAAKLFVSTLLVTAMLVGNTKAGEQKLNCPPDGFKAIFNGKDLTGWKGLVGNPKTRAKMSKEELDEKQFVADQSMNEHWKVVDGVIVFDGKGKSLCTANNYGDFEMFVDWKIKKAGDSGIYLRGTPQVQIWDTEHKPFFKNGADKGSGSLWNNKKNPRFPLVKADNPVGEWNTFRIRMIGERVSIWLNDKLVVDNTILENYWEPGKSIYAVEQIELQNHGNTLYFRNIYLKEFSRDE